MRRTSPKPEPQLDIPAVRTRKESAPLCRRRHWLWVQALTLSFGPVKCETFAVASYEMLREARVHCRHDCLDDVGRAPQPAP